jgi:hypothetical protein
VVAGQYAPVGVPVDVGDSGVAVAGVGRFGVKAQDTSATVAAPTSTEMEATEAR